MVLSRLPRTAALIMPTQRTAITVPMMMMRMHAIPRASIPSGTLRFSTATPSAPPTTQQPDDKPQPEGLAKFMKRIRDGDFDPFGRFKRTFRDLLLWILCGSLMFDLRSLRQDADDFSKTAAIKERKLLREIEEIRAVWDPAFVAPERKEEEPVESRSDRGAEMPARTGLPPGFRSGSPPGERGSVRPSREQPPVPVERVAATGTKIHSEVF
ncbi:hypothetical protein HDU98_005088 [Podochytrium sp. JEL0797]|nr:hypothetical protein HDU98_005088 [Podochytrium sp. JEL0797]